jgi:N-acetylmuramoyl-L-alanine amidase
MKILLDPGHGGWNGEKYVTPGKRSLHPVDGSWYYEGVENRKIALMWSDILEKHGHDVYFTVDPDDCRDISLTERVKIADALRPDLLVSIHSNGASNPNATGFEVFTAPRCSNVSERAADLWIDEMSDCFDLRNRGHKKSKFTMVQRPKSPSILLELAFHTNDDDVRLLRTWEFRFKSGLLLARILQKL